MIVVDFGHKQRDIGFHAVIARVGDDDVAGLGKSALDLRGDTGVRCGEDEARRVAGLAFIDRQIRDGFRHGAGEAPASGVAVLLPGRAIARAQPRQVEPRVILQKLDEMLADHAGGAENSYFNWLHKFVFNSEQIACDPLIDFDGFESCRFGTRSSGVCAT